MTESNIPTSINDLQIGEPTRATRGRKSVWPARARAIRELLLAENQDGWALFRTDLTPGHAYKIAQNYNKMLTDCEFHHSSVAGVATVWMRIRP